MRKTSNPIRKSYQLYEAEPSERENVSEEDMDVKSLVRMLFRRIDKFDAKQNDFKKELKKLNGKIDQVIGYNKNRDFELELIVQSSIQFYLESNHWEA